MQHVRQQLREYLLTTMMGDDVPALKQVYFQGRHALIQPLSADDIRILYPRPGVAAVLPVYRPGLGAQAGAEACIARLQALSAFEPPPEIEALVLHRATATPLGFMCLSGIDPLNAKAEFSVAFFRGRGSRSGLEAIHWALTYCFGTLELHKLIFYRLPDNNAARTMLAALGAPLEAVLREELISPQGGRVDLVRHALLRKDWMTSNARHRLERLVPLTNKSD